MDMLIWKQSALKTLLWGLKNTYKRFRALPQQNKEVWNL